MKKTFLTIFAVAVFFVGFCVTASSCNSSKKEKAELAAENTDDEGSNIEDADDDGPLFDATSGVVSTDTLYQDSNSLYCMHYGSNGKLNVLTRNNRVLLSDPTFYIERNEDTPNIFKIYCNFDTLRVDVSKPDAVEKIKALHRDKSQVEKFEYAMKHPKFDKVVYYFTVETPKSSFRKQKVAQDLLLSYLNPKSGSKDENDNPIKPFQGRSDDFEGMAKYFCKSFFECFDYDSESEIYDSQKCLVYKLTDHYITYQVSSSSYTGGAHGMYADCLVTFDLDNKCEMNWKYLFRPECKKQVENLFYDVVGKDSHFLASEHPKNRKELVDHFKDEKGRSVISAEGGEQCIGVCDKGIVFSFQPYEISYYAAGRFDFVLPFDRVKPFMTKRAIKVLGL